MKIVNRLESMESCLASQTEEVLKMFYNLSQMLNVLVRRTKSFEIMRINIKYQQLHKVIWRNLSPNCSRLFHPYPFDCWLKAVCISRISIDAAGLTILFILCFSKNKQKKLMLKTTSRTPPQLHLTTLESPVSAPLHVYLTVS